MLYQAPFNDHGGSREGGEGGNVRGWGLKEGEIPQPPSP